MQRKGEDKQTPEKGSAPDRDRSHENFSRHKPSPNQPRPDNPPPDPNSSES